jgi:hypothetical protein
MRKIFLILFALCTFTGRAYCQLNIIDNSREKLWYIISGTICGPIDTCKLETTVIKLANEAVINGLTYTPVLSSSDSAFTLWDTTGYLREVDRKVFYRPVSRDSDYLLYDFSLGLSSKIYLTNTFSRYDHSFEYTVSCIDSVFVGSEKRKRMFLSGFDNEIWIEGLGSFKGLIYSGLAIDGGFKELSCFSENGNIVYKNPKYGNCFCTTDIEPTKEIDSDIYSANGIVSLRGINDAIFQLYDLSGLQILNRKIESNNVNLDVSMLKNGVYLYNIKHHDSNTGGKLIIKDLN